MEECFGCGRLGEHECGEGVFDERERARVRGRGGCVSWKSTRRCFDHPNVQAPSDGAVSVRKIDSLAVLATVVERCRLHVYARLQGLELSNETLGLPGAVLAPPAREACSIARSRSDEYSRATTTMDRVSKTPF